MEVNCINLKPSYSNVTFFYWDHFFICSFHFKKTILTIAQQGINNASDPSLCRFFKSGPVPLFSFELFSSSRDGRAETKGTDKMIPLPVPTNKRSFVKSKAVILTKENPNFPVPEKLYTLQVTKTYLKIYIPHISKTFSEQTIETLQKIPINKEFFKGIRKGSSRRLMSFQSIIQR